jgi:thioredoxin-like negative regulator of GroEL
LLTFGPHGVVHVNLCYLFSTNWQKKYASKIDFGRLNVDDSQSIAVKYDVYAIPTFIIFYKGQAVERAVGAVGEKGLENILGQVP